MVVWNCKALLQYNLNFLPLIPMNNNNDLAQISTRFQYEDVISSCEKTKEFLAHFMEYGLAFLSNTPHQPDDLLKVKHEKLAGS